MKVTETAPFRYPYDHTVEDMAGKIDLRFARAVSGLEEPAGK